jgi:hypothetical protein
MSKRPSLGFDDDAEDLPATKTPLALDLSQFQPKLARRPDKESVERAAEQAQFRSREPKPLVTAPPSSSSARSIRRRRTGRSAQLNLKVRPDTIEQFYAIADANGWGLGEAFEKAVDLLTKAQTDPSAS